MVKRATLIVRPEFTVGEARALARLADVVGSDLAKMRNAFPSTARRASAYSAIAKLDAAIRAVVEGASS